MDLLDDNGQGHFQYVNVENEWMIIEVEGEIRAGAPDRYASQIGSIDLSNIFHRHGRNIKWIAVTGNSMMGERLHPGDLVVINPSKKPRFGDLVALHVNGAEQPVVKLWTERGIHSVYRDRMVPEKYSTAEIVGVVVFQIADRWARFDDDGSLD